MTTVCCERAGGQSLNNEEVQNGYVIVDSIDEGVPHGVLVLSLMNMERSAASIFIQAADVFGFNGTGDMLLGSCQNVERTTSFVK